jgi:hypothetical protein
MEERHLGNLEPPDIENATCLAVFGEQEFELDVPEQCLPYPARIDRLLKSGLAERTPIGDGRFGRYSLREPGWGRLILAATEFSPNRLEILVKAAVKSIPLILAISSRLLPKRSDDYMLFWNELALNLDAIIAYMPNAIPSYYAQFMKAADKNGKQVLMDGLWRAFNAQPESLAERVFDGPLQLTEFLHYAAQKRQISLVEAIWCGLAKQSEKLAALPLHILSVILSLAKQQDQHAFAQSLWYALAAKPESVAERAFKTPINGLGVFLSNAAEQGQSVLSEIVWRALTAKPDRLAEMAFASKLNDISSFMSTAERQDQNDLVEGLWRALAVQPVILSELAFASTLNDISAFVNTAQRQKQETLAEKLWQTLADQSDRLAKLAFASTLNDISAFANTAERQSQRALVESLWRAFNKQPTKLVEMAFASNLNDIGTFISTAERQKQSVLIAHLWQMLGKQVDMLAELAMQGPLNDVAAFVNTAKKQGQNDLIEEFWRALAKKLDTLAGRAAKEPPNPLMSFLVLAPNDLKKSLIQRFKVDDWAYGAHGSQRLSTGAAGLAIQFGLNGRDDLKNALVDNILRRKNKTDFSDLRSALNEMSRLLSLTSHDQESALVDLLKVVCTNKWLSGVYKLGSTVGLAGALHMIAVHQPPSIVQFFWNHALGARLKMELSQIRLLDDQGLIAAVELLGSSQLAGWAINRNLLFEAPLHRIGELPNILKHRPEAFIAEQWQRQLWLGLRVLASIGPGPVHVNPTVLVDTLNLWRKNIEGASDWVGTKDKPETTAHRINASMVKWLEYCAQTNAGLLLPNREPLWVLAGFPSNPKTIAN